MAILNEFLDGPGSVPGGSHAIAQRLEDQGLHVIVPNGQRGSGLVDNLVQAAVDEDEDEPRSAGA